MLIILALLFSIDKIRIEYIGSFIGYNSSAMIPELQPGDWLWSNRLERITNSQLKQGDIVSFYPPSGAGSEQNTIYVRRVLALPGDTVEMKSGIISINGVEYKENFLKVFWETQGCFDIVSPLANSVGKNESDEWLKKVTVPPDSVFVVGDNRKPSGSMDSRYFNSVPLKRVRGRVTNVFWPLSRKKLVKVSCDNYPNSSEYSEETVPNARAL